MTVYYECLYCGEFIEKRWWGGWSHVTSARSMFRNRTRRFHIAKPL